MSLYRTQRHRLAFLLIGTSSKEVMLVLVPYVAEMSGRRRINTAIWLFW